MKLPRSSLASGAFTPAFTLMFVLALFGSESQVSQTSSNLIPQRYLTQVGGFQIWSNKPIGADHAAIRSLMRLENQLQSQLAIRLDPSRRPVEIYILDDATAFQRFLKAQYPDLPTRRAFFLARGDRRVVYAYDGDRLREDLCHEATHAILHSSFTFLPLWLDEGLAEYFEVGDAQSGLNAEHLARFSADLEPGWRPDLSRLERLEDVHQMTPRDYREAWAWTHYLLKGPRPNLSILLSYLADLRSSPLTIPLSQRLAAERPDSSALLLAHLQGVTKAAQVQASPQRRLVYRGQSPVTTMEHPSRPVPQRAPRRGFLGTLRDLMPWNR